MVVTYAIIEHDNSVREIIRANNLEGFTRAWIEDTSIRPETTVFLDEENDIDKLVKICFIGSQEACDARLVEMAQAETRGVVMEAMFLSQDPAFVRLSQTVDNLVSQLNHLRTEVESLKNAIGKEEQKEGEVFKVGKYQVLVSQAQLEASTAVGVDCTGFQHLVRSVLPRELDGTRNWTQFDEELQQKLKDILAMFVRHYYSNVPDASPKDKDDKCKKIHYDFIRVLNSRKYRDRKRRSGAVVTTQKVEKEEPDEGFSDPPKKRLRKPRTTGDQSTSSGHVSNYGSSSQEEQETNSDSEEMYTKLQFY